MQAARGASLNDDAAAPTPSATPAPRRTRLRLLFAAVALAGWLLDQGTKVWAVSGLSDGRDRPLLGELLQLHLTRNPGAAFSTGTGATVLLSCVAIAATGVVLFFGLRSGHRAWSVALGVLLAGITGNLADRLLRAPGPLRGHVVDFLMLPNWPVFNVADMCINLAALLIVVLTWRGIRLDGRRDAGEPDAPAPREGRA